MDYFNETVAGIFILFISTEVILSACLGLDNYNGKDSLANFCIAGANAFLNLFFKGIAFAAYQFLEPYAPTHLGNQLWVWILLFLLTDLFYYLFHVLGHKSRFFWASHVVHHSSEKFNLTTALRSGITNTPFRFIFSAPLVLMGFSPIAVILMDSLVLIYTFFIHSEVVGKLGWIEKILNTPSHHRVHHGSDHEYLDKNFGAVLIFWDKLFGTFQPEAQRPIYGLTKPIRTHNPIKIALVEWVSLIQDVSRAKNWGEKISYTFGRPGWHPSLKPLLYTRNTFLMMARAVAVVLISIGPLQAQSIDETINQGLQNEREWKDEAALKQYEEALKIQPNHPLALVRTSRMLCNIGGRSKDKEFKRNHAMKAKQIALKAIHINNKDIEAHLCYVLSLGIVAEMADNPREKLANAKIIKREAEYILTLDSTFAPAYYILGKWHFAIASLSRIEVIVCSLLFGGVPEGASIDKALYCYEKAIGFWPDYIVFYYGKALVLHFKGEELETIVVLKKALQLAPRDPDDHVRLIKCQRLLQQTQQSL
jgi:sterol desaturase/sphingolipid hydroxylase (fatty acid hydroxylase superfamily)